MTIEQYATVYAENAVDVDENLLGPIVERHTVVLAIKKAFLAGAAAARERTKESFSLLKDCGFDSITL